jgi:beta-glucosidase
MALGALLAALLLAGPAVSAAHAFAPRGDLHFPLHARGTNKDGSVPTYKNPHASVEDRVADLLPRMTLEEKVSQLCVVFCPRL